MKFIIIGIVVKILIWIKNCVLSVVFSVVLLESLVIFEIVWLEFEKVWKD